MNKAIHLFFLFVICLSFIPIPGNATDEDSAQNNQDVSVITFEGRVSCQLNRPVFMPFSGIFTDIKITPGQLVKKGAIVAQYDIDEDRAIQIGRELLSTEQDELKRYQEIEKRKIIGFERKEQELIKLTAENLAPQYLLNKLQAELRLTRMYLTILEKRLVSARFFSGKALNNIRKLLGDSSLSPGQIPKIVRLKSPIEGVVLSLHKQLKKDSLLPAGTIIATIGTMDTMLIHSLVYERDVVHLTTGDKVNFSPDSLPERSFPAIIKSINWSPATHDPDLPSYYQVEMTVKNDNLELRAGFKGRVEYQQKSIPPPTL